jgi:nucleoside-diphosphate-sugar epimerase
MQSKPTVLITGISGFLGSTICHTFLKDGTFNIIGTIRDVKNEKKLAPLRKAFGDLFNQLTLREADLNNEQSMINACEGAQFVVHTASPVTIHTIKDE